MDQTHSPFSNHASPMDANHMMHYNNGRFQEDYDQGYGHPVMTEADYTQLTNVNWPAAPVTAASFMNYQPATACSPSYSNQDLDESQLNFGLSPTYTNEQNMNGASALGGYLAEFPKVGPLPTLADVEAVIPDLSQNMSIKDDDPATIMNNYQGAANTFDQPTTISGQSIMISTASSRTQSIKGPHRITIIEEPQEFGYRFRYQVEGGAHGGLQGQSSKANGHGRKSKTYPQIKIEDVPENIDEVTLEVRLVTTASADDPHPNKLTGKHCNSAGIYWQKLKRSSTRGFTVEFDNMAISQIKKPDQKESLLGQLQHVYDQKLLMGYGDDYKSPKDLLEMAEEQAQIKFSGAVRLRIQASFKLSDTEWAIAVKHSQPIHDAKQTSASELKICRISSSSCVCTGGAEIFLLCEKVAKDDIKVRFKHNKWSSDGIFNSSDVHHQFAIVFKVPPYKDTNITKPVDVDLKLYRPSTKTYSRPVTFKYTPPVTDQDQMALKRKRPNPGGPADMGYPPNPHGPYGGAAGAAGGRSSDGFSGWPQGGGGGGSRRGAGGGGGMSHAGAGGEYGPPSSHGYQGSPVVGEDSRDSTDTVTEEEGPVDLSHTQFPVRPATIEIVEADYAKSGTAKPGTTLSQVIKQEVKPPLNKDKAAAAATTDQVKQEMDVDKPNDSPVEHTDEVETDCSSDDEGDLEADGAGPTPLKATKFIPQVLNIHKPSQLLTSSTEPEIPMETTNQISSLEKELEMSREQTHTYKTLFDRLKADICDYEYGNVDCLMKYASTGDPTCFISRFRYFLAVADEYGDNSIHLAILNNQLDVLTSMLQVCSSTNTTAVINQYNDQRQTPIHTAVILRNTVMVDRLLLHGADPFLADLKGDNSFHIAASAGEERTLQKLCYWVRSKNKDRSQLDLTNNAGAAAIHLAVQARSVGCVEELIKTGIDVDAGHRNNGRTALHMAIDMDEMNVCIKLIADGRADVNAQAYDGNTPLHLAVSAQNKNLTRLLLSVKADIDICNYDGEGETPIDLTTPTQEIYDILCGGRSSATSVPPSNRISNLDDEVRNKLSNMLDKSSSDWRRLAEEFGLSSIVSLLEEDRVHTPTSRLLDYLDNDGTTVEKLIEKLSSLGRRDCTSCIKKSKQRKRSPGPRKEKLLMPGSDNSKILSVAGSGVDGGYISGPSAVLSGDGGYESERTIDNRYSSTRASDVGYSSGRTVGTNYSNTNKADPLQTVSGYVSTEALPNKADPQLTISGYVSAEGLPKET